MTTINSKTYALLEIEFNPIDTNYSTLKVLNKLGHYDRITSIISEIHKLMKCRSFLFGATTHGGYIPINCISPNTKFLFDTNLVHQQNIYSNIVGAKQFVFVSDLTIINPEFIRNSILFVESYHSKYDEFITKYQPIIISDKPFLDGYTSYTLSNTRVVILIPDVLNAMFSNKFITYIQNEVFDYDNLINLCVIVKNGGDDFVDMLQANLPYIDRWTILDTGSTDNTVENIKRIMSGKQGALYEEPFINFGASRNRCLELAGTQCTYNVMLDDTYHLKGDLRTFLQYIRGDQFADSFSLYITQHDLVYASNRVFKSSRNLKYKYAIHEVIQEENNANVIIPKQTVFVHDVSSDKLAVRTFSRKQQDLNMLQTEIDTNQSDPRPYYYMAQTYTGMENYEKAYEWFLKRIHHPNPGFQQEKHEACLEAGRIAQFVLKKPSAEYMCLYEAACVVDPERPDALYFIGVFYLSSTPPNVKMAFETLLKGFKLGFPEHRQYCLKPLITYTHIPKLLSNCCYDMKEYGVGETATALYLKHNTATDDPTTHSLMVSWNKIFTLLNYSEAITKNSTELIYPDLPICCIIAPCGLYNWTGSDILKNGMGGSESMIVEIATQLQKRGNMLVVVFCNCLQEELFNNVQYVPLQRLFATLNTYFIHTCIISRYSEYLPVVIKSNVENIFLMAQDVAFSGNIITLDRKLKGVFCLTPFHAGLIETQYPILKPFIKLIGHGIDLNKIKTNKEDKIPCKFIYSSLANRGLHTLLRMWPKITKWNPNASLYIYSDVESPYMLQAYSELMTQIKELLNSKMSNIFYYGCVNKHILYESWKTADVWFYPTTYQETFCVTALEAAASKTLVIATNVGGLQHTVADRGVLIDAPNEITNEWMDNAVAVLIQTMENIELKDALITKNYEWAIKNTWEQQTTVVEQFLLSNQFEYRDVYNWLDSASARTTFVEIFHKYLKPRARMLETGAKNGISFIAMLFEIPDSTGVAIDAWNTSQQYRRSFDTNIKTARLSDRITAMQTDSLNELYKVGDSFDLIHLNNEDDAELLIAWKMLKPGGILIIRSLSNQFINPLIMDVVCRDDSRIFIHKKEDK